MFRDLSRRRFLVRSAALGGLGMCGWRGLATDDRAGGGLSVGEAFDREMEHYMSARRIPGGALAVVKDRRLVYVRGYGWADREKREPVRPPSLFRIASLSKPVTAAAVLRLAQDGRLELEGRILDLLRLEPLPGVSKSFDERWKQVTIRHCLHHTGGWDRDKSGDPMFRSVEIARAAGAAPPAAPGDIARYMAGRPLDFDPGARYAYSNFGYSLLGRVIEKVTGGTYEGFVRQQVLAPMGIKGMRLGASLESGRRLGEVKYYTMGESKGSSVFPGEPREVPLPYGTFCLEAMDSHGGWVASVVDLARFVAGLDDPGDNAALRARTRGLFSEIPAAPVSRTASGGLADHYYGCGWLVRPTGGEGRANYWHTGSLPGTYALMVRRFDGLSWVALFNQRSDSSTYPDDAIDPALHRAADAVREWPSGQLAAPAPPQGFKAGQ